MALVHWQQFVLHWGATPSITDFYTETHTIIQASLEEAAAVHSATRYARILELRLDLHPQLFAASDTCRPLHRP